MRYHIKKPNLSYPVFGRRYYCNHPVYGSCTLYGDDKKGLAVIQQRMDPVDKSTWWGPVDSWLANIIFVNPGFQRYYNDHADVPDENGLYPTVSVRQIMWALRMKPLKKERWETVFDRPQI